MTPKAEKFFSQKIWHHGTTLAGWKSICQKSILADYNVGISCDFGNGFYISPDQHSTEVFAENYVKYNQSDLPDNNIPVVIVFDFVPIEHIVSEERVKYFAKYDDEFAEFVFTCRENYLQACTHGFVMTGGVMTDAVPTMLMNKYFTNQISKQEVITEFKKGTSKKQLCLHEQSICDKLIINKAYIVNGKELDINEYRKK